MDAHVQVINTTIKESKEHTKHAMCDKCDKERTVRMKKVSNY